MDKQAVSAWLEPLDGEACGLDLEYDPGFMELEQAAAGKPETQFGPAEAPNWETSRELAEQLFGRTRDVRVAMLWARATIHLEGLEALPAGLTLLHGLLERHWDELHPRPDPDDGDTFARLSVLGSLAALDGLLGDVRQAQLIVDRRLSGLRVRTVEIALEKLAPRADEQTSSPALIEGMLGNLPDLAERLRTSIDASLQSLKELQSLMNARFGADQAVDLKALRGMLTAVQSLLPQNGGEQPVESASDNPPDSIQIPVTHRSEDRVTVIESRKDAVRAIQLVCAYLERSEPTNPAQLLLRRAERLIDKDFLQLVRDLAPDAVNEVARILGVDPESVRDSGTY